MIRRRSHAQLRPARRSSELESLWAVLDLGSPDTSTWMQFGVCMETAPDAFFPERGESTAPAKAVCVGCPVRTECLNYAVTRNERFGVWGGLSERERRPLVRQLQERDAGRQVA